MTRASPTQPSPLPPWLIGLGSAAVAGHLLALLVSVLAAPSGPWPTDYGRDMALPPVFASELDNIVRPRYLRPLKMTHNYHFATNRSEMPGVFFQVELKDDAGKTLETLRFPEEDANPWVRHRQSLLARALADDQPVQPRTGVAIAAAGKEARTVEIWERAAAPDQSQWLKTVPEVDILLQRQKNPNSPPVWQPSELSKVLAQSYARYLCRTHGAARAVISRHSREPFSPVVLFQPTAPQGPSEELIARFEELPK